MKYLLLLSVLTPFAFAAPIPKDTTANTLATLQILRELGLADNFGKLPDVPAKYAPDSIAADIVRKNADLHSLRAVILKAAEVVKNTRQNPFLREIKALNGEPDRKAIKTIQEKIALQTLELEEAAEDLHALEKLTAKEENLRWVAHYEFLTAWIAMEIALHHEANKAFAKALIDDLPKPAEGHDGWKLAPLEKMQSNRQHRTLAKEAKELFGRISKLHPNTPWGDLAQKRKDELCGLRLESANLGGK